MQRNSKRCNRHSDGVPVSLRGPAVSDPMVARGWTHMFAFSTLTHTNVHQLSQGRIHYTFVSLQLLEMTAPSEWVYACVCVCDLPLFHYITCHFHFSSAAYRNFCHKHETAAAAEFYGSMALMDNKTDTQPLNP